MILHVSDKSAMQSRHDRSAFSPNGLLDCLMRWSLRRGEAASAELAAVATATLPVAARSDVPFLLNIGLQAA